MWCWVLMEGMLSFNRVIRLCHSTTSHWKLKALVELFTSGDISNYSPIVLVWLEAVSKCREKLRTDIKIGSLLFFGSIWNITRCIAGLHTHIYTQISDSFKAIRLLHKCSFLYIFTWLSAHTHTQHNVPHCCFFLNHIHQSCYTGIILSPLSLLLPVANEVANPF